MGAETLFQASARRLSGGEGRLRSAAPMVPAAALRACAEDKGAVLNQQSHARRSGHWIVAGRSAKVTVNDGGRPAAGNESAGIPLGAVRRPETPGRLPVVLTGVQTGAYGRGRHPALGRHPCARVTGKIIH